MVIETTLEEKRKHKREYMRIWIARRPDYYKKQYAKNSEKIKEQSRRNYAKNREKAIEWNKKWRLKNLQRASETGKAWYVKNRENYSKQGKALRQKRKFEVLLHYSPLGSKTPKCAHCGTEDLRVLSLDHVNGGGVVEAKRSHRLGSVFYGYLRKNNYPKNPPLQTLCMNCQFIKRVENNEVKKTTPPT
jgi:hypothetical protein